MISNKDPHRYDYMLNMEPPKLIRKISRAERAAQFVGFRALTGHEELIDETARFTDKQLELDELEKASLDYKMQRLMKELHKEPVVRIKYFENDLFKAGGRYISHTGIIKKIDLIEKEVIFVDGLRIAVKTIVSLQSDIFCEEEY